MYLFCLSLITLVPRGNSSLSVWLTGAPPSTASLAGVITEGEETRLLPPDTSINIHALIPCIVNGHFYHAENSGAATRITHHNHAGAAQAKEPSPRHLWLRGTNLMEGKHKDGDAVLPSTGLRLSCRAIELIGACYLNF